MQNISSQMTGGATNINQIAKRVNSTDNIYADDIQELKDMTDEIWQSLKSILSKPP